MDNFLSKGEVIDQLWLAYKKTPEYKKGLIDGIAANNPLVINQEKEGLKRIYIYFVHKLNSSTNAKEELKNRTIGDWLDEWKKMHEKLFEFVLKKRGIFRQNKVRFGYPGDEDLYKIPPPNMVPKQIMELAYKISKSYLTTVNITEFNKLTILSKIHFEFIRIHPFPDGNGRIARAITDQLAIFFDFPIAMAGYPRLDDKRRLNYHKAIRSCLEDPECSDLANWIKGYIDQRLSTLA